MRKMLTRLRLATLLLGVAAFTSGCALTSEAAKLAPAITSLTPNSAVGGGLGFTLTVNGTNFQRNSVVLWNGAARATTFNSKVLLQAAIPSSDVATPTTVEISVLTPPFRTNSSNTFPFVIASQLQITTSNLPSATAQKSYNAPLADSGGVAPYSWTVSSGHLPPGLALSSSTGVISGMATSTGSYPFTAQVKDSGATPQSASKSLTLSVVSSPSTLLISTTILPNGTVQAAYSATLAASGGLTPYTWSVISGALPAGLSLNASTGALSGTPTQTGGFTFTIQVKDSESTPQAASNTFSISINNPPAQITTSSLPGGQVNVAYSTTLAASGGTQPYSWAITVGSLPAGLSLSSSTGAISGTPTASGTATFTAQVKDSSATQQSASKQLSIAIAAAAPSPVSITTTGLSGGTAQVSYSATLAASGGTQPYSWAITVGSLPAGLSLSSSTGAISGTPTTSGTATFTVQVKDSSATQQSASKQLSIAIAAAAPSPVSITTTGLSGGTAQVSYSATLAASGGTQPYSWAITVGSLPAGLSLSSSTGAISGTPTSSGTATFTVQVKDSSATQQ